MLRVQNLTKSYGDQVLLDDTGFLMTPGERLGLVARNGYGKSTLFKLLLGEEEPDSGEILTPRGYTIGHLSQHLRFDHDSVLEEVAVGLDEGQRYRAEAALMGLGFARDELSLPAERFSGGYQIRVNLARVLVQRPDLLLLDEPTNYLDIVSVRWLARFLRGWRGELILITHDRSFLRAVTTHSMVIHRRQLRRMEGSLEKLVDQIATEEEVAESARLNEEKKRRQEERFIERFRSKASKASVVQSRIKQLEKREKLEAVEQEAELSFRFRQAPFHATTMLRVDGLAFGYPDGPTLIDGLSVDVEKGDRLAIVGPNGRGKTTLLELLAGELTAQRGTIKANPNVAMACFGQTNIDRLHAEHTIEQELASVAPDASRSAIRGLCGLLMFPGEAAEKSIPVLSGGERSRVLLGKLLLQEANLLLLDEPTNHLDLESVEGLLDAVDAFDGAVLLVTHDEHILERVATRLIVFDGGRVQLFEGGYRDFLERIGWQDEAADSSPRKAPAKDLRRQRAEIVQQRARATADLRRRVERLESTIEDLEAKVAAADAGMAEAAEQGRNEDLTRLATDAAAWRKAIDAAFDELEPASEALDAARAEFDARLEALEP